MPQLFCTAKGYSLNRAAVAVFSFLNSVCFIMSGSLFAQVNTADLSRAAREGDMKARFKLAEIYLLGIDGPYKPDSAIILLSPAADTGNTEACYLLGNLYLRSHGALKDQPKGLKLLEKAGDGGSMEAIHVLTDVYYGKDASGPFADPALIKLKNYPALYRIAKKGCEAKDPSSCYFMGICYYEGWGVTKQDSLARIYIERSAIANYGAAQLLLADWYFYNDAGCGYDYQRSYKWYKLIHENRTALLEDQGWGLEGILLIDRGLKIIWNQVFKTTFAWEDWQYSYSVFKVRKEDKRHKRY